MNVIQKGQAECHSISSMSRWLPDKNVMVVVKRKGQGDIEYNVTQKDQAKCHSKRSS